MTPRRLPQLAAPAPSAQPGLDKLVQQLRPPRAVWVMLPAGKITEDVIAELANLLQAGDVVIDGGNTFWKDDIRRAKMLNERSIHHVDVGTSGGIWGLERGYCMMIGGTKEIVDRLDPIFKALAPGLGDVPRTPGRDGRDPRAEQGYIHAGPNGAGHFVKMVHNGIEYGLMQAFAEGFDILKNADSDNLAEDMRFRPRSHRHCRSLASRQRHQLVAPRSHRQRAGGRSKTFRLRRRGRGFRRRPLDHHGRDRRGGAGRRAIRCALHPLSFAPRAYFCGKNSVGDAQGFWRPCRAKTAAADRKAKAS